MRSSEYRYLLRVWREPDHDGPWQATLRNVADGDLTTFGDLEGLVGFLESEAQRSDQGEGSESQEAKGEVTDA